MTRQDVLTRFQDQCQANGIKLTPQRAFIYEELLNTTEHPSAEMLYSALKSKYPMITLDTVHRTLNLFCELGVAAMVEGTGSSKRFEGNLDIHHHVRCVRCGRIHDVYNVTYDQLAVPPEVTQEFEIFKTTVHLEGLCRMCRQTQAAEDTLPQGGEAGRG
jgi:Fur family transcriptional regulator, peroxide stress response regulator